MESCLCQRFGMLVTVDLFDMYGTYINWPTEYCLNQDVSQLEYFKLTVKYEYTVNMCRVSLYRKTDSSQVIDRFSKYIRISENKIACLISTANYCQFPNSDVVLCN